MDWKERIIVDSNTLVGKPVIKGTRIAVELLMYRLSVAVMLELPRRAALILTQAVTR
jgi:uncharacterized protein (DUF433 family)